MNKRVYRLIQNLLLFVTVTILSISYYFQYAKGLQPCPLCIMQRICIFLFGMCCMMGFSLSTLKRARTIGFFQFGFAFAGLLFAGRQLWLQLFPSENPPACLPGFEVMFKYLPWRDILHSLFWGAGECSEITWQWLGLTMPAWTALYFTVMSLASLCILFLLNRVLKKL